MKNQWSRWYWKDFEGDAALRRCGHVAGSIWMHMLAIMSTNDNTGYFMPGGKKIEDDEAHTVISVPTTKEQMHSALKQLEQFGVFSRTKDHPTLPDGIIYCRRILREQARREKMRQLGLKSAAARQRKAQQSQPRSAASAAPAQQPQRRETREERLVRETQERIDAGKKR